MYFLTDTTKSLSCRTLEGISLAYGALDCVAVYVVNTQRAEGVDAGPVSVLSDIGDSYTEIVPAPVASHTQHSVKSIHVNNTDNINHNLEFSILGKVLFKCMLMPGNTVAYYNETGWKIYNSSGSELASVSGLPLSPSGSATYVSVGGDSIMTNDLIDGFTILQWIRSIRNLS